MSKPLDLGDTFYWLNLTSVDDWELGVRLIKKSKVRSIHAPTGMYENHQGRYFRASQCYPTLEAAVTALKEWLEQQQEIISAISEELGDYK